MSRAASLLQKSFPLFTVKLLRRSISTTTKRIAAKAQKWELKVQPFWFLNILVERCNINVLPFDPVENPNADRLTFNLNAKTDFNEDDFHLECNEHEKLIKFSQKATDLNYVTNLIVKTPPGFNLDINSKGRSDVYVSALECDVLTVKAKTGNITLNHIKGTQITAETGLGDIQSNKLLQGNLALQTEKGEISLKQIQSCSAEISNRCGSLIVQDVYTDQLSANCDDGSIQFKSLHGDCHVKADGSIDIGTAEGRLDAVSTCGNIDVHIAEHQNVKLNCLKGDIALSVAPGLNATLQLKGNCVDVECDANNKEKDESQTFKGDLGHGGPIIEANATKGNITMKTSSWMNRIVKFRTKT
uniref:Uncharacterized protein LOC100184533 n=1 Tax=Phallusia mammillata TaxID=59560 RepID=A0A6F9DHE6_9ASCI|nr:uncharacterized protein LOC100184533 [Phallusia mammillata]